jgi:hypothetical protein
MKAALLSTIFLYRNHRNGDSSCRPAKQSGYGVDLQAKSTLRQNCSTDGGYG